MRSSASRIPEDLSEEALAGVLSARALSPSQADRIAFRFLKDGEDDAVCFTYAQLHERARALAAGLADVEPGSRVLLLYAPGLEYIVGVFACAYAGLVAVPAYPPRFNRPMGRLEALIADAQATVALTTQDLLTRIQRHLKNEAKGTAPDEANSSAQGETKTASLEEARSARVSPSALAALRWIASDEETAAQSPAQPPRPVDPTALALLQYTSGSTSLPRGVQLTHADLMANARALMHGMAVTPEDRIVTWLPPYHDMGLIGTLLAPILFGAEVTLLAPTSFVQRPLRWLRAISRYRGTVSGGPDSAYQHCVRRISVEQRPTLDLSTWRVAFSGAERVRAETFEQFAEAFAVSGFKREAFQPCYGLAEATLGVCAAPVTSSYVTEEVEEGRTLVSSGRALPGFEVLTVDLATRVPTDGMGEIWVRGPSVSQGYWNKPEKNAEVFGGRLQSGAGPYLRTGDLGFLRGGELFVAGRLKDLIILLGRNHYPEDLELTAQNAHAAVRPAAGAAFSVDVEGTEQLVLAQEVDLAPGQDPGEISVALRNAISDAHELPLHDVVLLGPGGVPRTTSGKIQRSRCRELYLEGKLERLQPRARRQEKTAAPDALVRRIAALMSELLGVSKVGANDDFFALGGHSLVATQLASRLRDTVGVELPVRALFESPTPVTLARHVASLQARPATPPIVPVPRDQPLRLSFSQERMWYLYQLEPESSAYNVCGALRVDGESLDVPTLRAAFADVVRRHEVLRTAYPAVDGEPRCVLVPNLSAELQVFDATEEEAQRRADALACAPFDLARGPLFRAELYRVKASHHVLAVSLHHVVIDGWSMGVLLTELSSTYARMRSGDTSAQSPPALQYADYAHWQRALFTPEHLATALEFWKKKLANPPLLELPTDHPRSPNGSWRGGLEPLELPGDLLDGVRDLAVRHGVTPFMVMLATFKVLLYRYTGQTDLAVGVPIANRTWQTSEQFLGTLVNTLVLRTELAPDRPFIELLARVKDTALDAYAHQDLPFEQLVTKLAIERQRGRSPLFQVMFDYQNAPMRWDGLSALNLKPLPVHRGASQFELSLFVLDGELGRSASAEYASELFDAATIHRLLHHYRSLLEAVVADPRQTVQRLPMLSALERRALTEDRSFVARSEAPDALVPQRIAAQARLHPQARAVSDAHRTLTYAELTARSGSIAGQLRELGARPGDRVAVALERSTELVTALLGVLEAGAAYVPLDYRHPPERLRLVLEDARPTALLTQRSVRAQLPVVEGVRFIDIEDLSNRPSPLLSEGATANDVAYVLFTSGSTGRPKGVEVPHRALSNFLSSMRREPGIFASDHLLAITTVSFDIAGLELFLPLVSGAHVEVVASEVAADPRLLREKLERSGATFMQATPATWRMLIESGWKGDGALKVLCGGEAMPRELADALLARGGSVWNMYGPTETTIWSTVERVKEGSTAVPIGAPVDNTQLYVLDAALEPVPRGVKGELFIGGHGVARGYLGRPELTAERFLADPFSKEPGARMYRTGDAARWKGDALEFLGRLDNQVKVRGFRIELGEIEAALKTHASIRDAVVLAREERPGDVRLVAYYLTSAPVTVDALKETAKAKLPDYMVPTAWVELDAWPLTPNAKVDRRALPKPFLETAASRRVHAPPLEPLEREVAALLEETLGIQKVGLNDSFFELGGHSLLAVKLFAQLERRTGIALPLSTLFSGPTVAELADAAQRAREQGGGKGPLAHRVRIQRGGALPPFFCVHGAGGNVLNLHELAKGLGPEQPVYGLQARGVDGREPPHQRIEEMAERYLLEVRALQPNGPYYLGGYCGGGLIAYEMARQLTRQDERVAALVMLDTYHPSLKLKTPGFAERLDRVSLEGPAYLWRKGRERVARELKLRADELKIRMHQSAGETIPYELRDLQLTYAFLEAAAHYQPVPIPARLTLFHALDEGFQVEGAGRELGWTGHGLHGIDVESVPGTHETMMFAPHVGVLAEKTGAALQRAREEAQARKL
ncbi:MAG: amino acid adenylation domain-containing protein [Myxococcaceae bacterium]